MSEITDCSYSEKIADAECKDCSWKHHGADGPTRRLARQHTNETRHTTDVVVSQVVTYKRERI